MNKVIAVLFKLIFYIPDLIRLKNRIDRELDELDKLGNDNLMKVEDKSSEMPWLQTAYSQIGIKEILGLRHNPQIILYHQATSLKATTDEVPWCSAFVCWVMMKSGVQSTNSAAARSWLDWGRQVIDPYPGCVVILKAGTESWQGHVGFFIGVDPKNKERIWVLGGNQKDRVCISDYPKKNVLGYRAPLLNS